MRIEDYIHLEVVDLADEIIIVESYDDTLVSNIKEIKGKIILKTKEQIPSFLKDVVINGKLFMRDLGLTNLYNMPKKVNWLDMSANKLTSLNGITPEVETLFVRRNLLTNIDDAPRGLKNLQLDHNKLTVLQGIKSVKIHTINLSNNPIEYIKDCPEVSILALENSKLSSVSNIPKHDRLLIRGTPINKYLDGLTKDEIEILIQAGIDTTMTKEEVDTLLSSLK